MYDKLKYTLKVLNKSNKIKCIFLGNTVKKENSSFYISDVRENEKFIYSSIIMYNNFFAKKISSFIDGKVDYVLVDTEKKIISKNKNTLVNIEKSIKETIKRSKILTYKGNDLTVQAADTFINNFFINDARGVGGKKILILGCGNIGFKIGLKLIESGGNVYLYRRNKKKLLNLVRAINYIKPKGTIATAKSIFNFDQILYDVDILIGSTDGSSVLLKKHVNKFKKKILILDIGKGIFAKNALKLALSKKYILYRLDITPAYNSYLENVTSTIKINTQDNFRIVKKKNLLLAKKGILTEEGTVIVDNLNNPKKVYGVSDGSGSFKNLKISTLRILENRIKNK